jgi:hypothetical protein
VEKIITSNHFLIQLEKKKEEEEEEEEIILY